MKKLSTRQRKLVKNVASGRFPSGRQAMIAAGYSAQSSPAVILNRPLVRSELTKALEAAGIGYADIVKPVKDALTAIFANLASTSDDDLFGTLAAL